MIEYSILLGEDTSLIPFYWIKFYCIEEYQDESFVFSALASNFKVDYHNGLPSAILVRVDRVIPVISSNRHNIGISNESEFLE